MYVGGGFLAEEIIYLYTSHLDFFKVIQNTSNPENELEVFFVKGDLLVIPQLTHYLLDGFIWRKPKKVN